MTDLNLVGSLVFYAGLQVDIGTVVDLSSDSFEMLLCTDSYVPSIAHTTSSDITGEVANSGYARQALVNVDWSKSGSLTVFSFDSVVFEAPDEDIPAKYWVIVNTTLDLLVCYGLLNSNGDSITIEETKDMTISYPGGLFTLGTE